MSCTAEVESRTEEGSSSYTVLSPSSVKLFRRVWRMQLASRPSSHGPEGLQLLILVSQDILAAGSKPCMFSGTVNKQYTFPCRVIRKLKRLCHEIKEGDGCLEYTENGHLIGVLWKALEACKTGTLQVKKCLVPFGKRVAFRH